MTEMPKYPEGDDWKDHAPICPNCGEPVADEGQHSVAATMTDPAWWKCDAAQPEQEG